MFKNPMQKQFLTTKEDIENKDVKDLANRLRGKDDKETLTNVLEWQEKNLSFWWERWPFDLSLKFLIPLTWVLILIISFPFLLILLELYPLLLILSLAIILLFSIMFLFSKYFIKFLILIVSVPSIYLIISIILQIPSLAPKFIPYVLFYAGCIGALSIIGIYLFFRYRVFLRGMPFMKKFSKFIEMMDDTFIIKLPIEKILKYRLAICRDYAKLTAVLLFNLYPNSKLYFFTILGHVATSIKIGDNYYILDQKLPILTKNNWLRVWNKKKTQVYVAELKKDSEKVEIKKYGKIVFSKSAQKTSFSELTENVAKVLKLSQVTNKRTSDFQILLKNCAIIYEDDEIVKYSLVRAIRNKIVNEFCGNLNKISKIEMVKKKNDLILKVYTKT